MNNSSLFRGVLLGFSTFAIVGYAAAQSSPVNPSVSNPALGTGQESTLHTPQGETGTPHSHPSGDAQNRTDGGTSTGRMGAPGGEVTPSMPAGQESTQHTPQGETGTPHSHPNANAQDRTDRNTNTGRMGAPGGGVTPSMPAGQESTQHTPQGETGTPHGHSK